MTDRSVEERASATGRCMCGGVAYRVTGPMRPVVNCHCDRCRRSTGHFMAASSCDIADLHLGSSATLAWYRATEDVEYGFCGRCGSSLFWRTADRPQAISIAAGTIDPPPGLTTETALFVSEASDYHRLDRSLHALPGDWPPS